MWVRVSTTTTSRMWATCVTFPLLNHSWTSGDTRSIFNALRRTGPGHCSVKVHLFRPKSILHFSWKPWSQSGGLTSSCWSTEFHQVHSQSSSPHTAKGTYTLFNHHGNTDSQNKQWRKVEGDHYCNLYIVNTSAKPQETEMRDFIRCNPESQKLP